MPSEQDALTVTGLSYSYGTRKALRDVTFSVKAGTLFALLGPNGGGKTTLFRIASTLSSTSPGHVKVFGHDVATEDATIRKLIGVVFQSPSLDGQLTVSENLRCHGLLYGLRGGQLESRIGASLAFVGLSERSSDLVRTLSGGLQRRIELAKAWLPDPRILILDEPSTGLDPGARREIWNHLDRLRREHGTSIVLTTHLMDEAARSDQVAILHNGQLVALGSPQELVNEVGGDVILISSRDVDRLAAAIREQLDQHVDILDGQLRIERPRGHKFIADLVEMFPNEIEAITFGKPSLEDVFLHHTGQPWN